MGTLNPHSNGPLYSNTVIGIYTGRWWLGCYIWCSEEGSGRAVAPHSPLLAAFFLIFVTDTTDFSVCANKHCLLIYLLIYLLNIVSLEWDIIKNMEW